MPKTRTVVGLSSTGGLRGFLRLAWEVVHLVVRI